MQLNPEAFGGKLAEAIKTHTRLVGELVEARETLATAEAALVDAQKAGIAATVQAKLDGTSATESSRLVDAEAVCRAAEYDVKTSHQAVLAALDRMVDETSDARYAQKLEKTEQPIKARAIKLLDGLEDALAELAEVKANRTWLDKPVKADKLQRPTVQDVWIGAESVRHPNGDHARSKDLTRPLREALLDTDKAPNTQQDWGIPPGSKMAGPWGVAEPIKSASMTGAAARVFDEIMAEPPAA